MPFASSSTSPPAIPQNVPSPQSKPLAVPTRSRSDGALLLHKDLPPLPHEMPRPQQASGAMDVSSPYLLTAPLGLHQTDRFIPQRRAPAPPRDTLPHAWAQTGLKVQHVAYLSALRAPASTPNGHLDVFALGCVLDARVQIFERRRCEDNAYSWYAKRV